MATTMLAGPTSGRARRSRATGCAAWLVAACIGAGTVGAGIAAADPSTATPCAARLADQISTEFPQLSVDARPQPESVLPEHAQGRALDVLIDNYTDPGQIAVGDAVVARIHQLAADQAYPVQYTLWRQTYIAAGQEPIPVADRGSDAQNNNDHIHVALAAATC